MDRDLHVDAVRVDMQHAQTALQSAIDQAVVYLGMLREQTSDPIVHARNLAWTTAEIGLRAAAVSTYRRFLCPVCYRETGHKMDCPIGRSK